MNVETLTDEEGRLAALHRLGLPGVAGPHEPLAALLRVAATALGAPYAAVSLIDRTRRIRLVSLGISGEPIERARSIASLALEGTEVVVGDTRTDPRTAMGTYEEEGVQMRAFLGAPLVSAEGYVLGCLELIYPRLRQFTPDDLSLARDLAGLAFAHLQSLQSDARDALTGAMTRRRFQRELEREFDRCNRYDRPAALVFFEIDGFQDLSRTTDLLLADTVLKSVANRALEMSRPSDSLGRIGTESFALLLPETMAYEASQCAERLREEIAALAFHHRGQRITTTSSFGIEPLNPDIRSAVEWFARADIALYGARQSGRNCVAFGTFQDDSAQGQADDTREGTPPSRLH